MARANQICRHPQRTEIDRAILSGEPFTRIAAKFGIKSESTVRLYAARGCPDGDAPPKEARQKAINKSNEARGLDGLEILKEALADLDVILRGAIGAGSFGAAATAARGKIEIAKTLGIQKGGGGDGSALAKALEKLGDGAWDDVEKGDKNDPKGLF